MPAVSPFRLTPRDDCFPTIMVSDECAPLSQSISGREDPSIEFSRWPLRESMSWISADVFTADDARRREPEMRVTQLIINHRQEVTSDRARLLTIASRIHSLLLHSSLAETHSALIALESVQHFA